MSARVSARAASALLLAALAADGACVNLDALEGSSQDGGRDARTDATPSDAGGRQDTGDSGGANPTDAAQDGPSCFIAQDGALTAPVVVARDTAGPFGIVGRGTDLYWANETTRDLNTAPANGRASEKANACVKQLTTASATPTRVAILNGTLFALMPGVPSGGKNACCVWYDDLTSGLSSCAATSTRDCFAYADDGVHAFVGLAPATGSDLLTEPVTAGAKLPILLDLQPVIATVSNLLAPLAAYADTVYLATESGALESVRSGGTGPAPLGVVAKGAVMAMSIDPAGKVLFWLDSEGSLFGVSVSGSAPRTSMSLGSVGSAVHGASMQADADYLYVTNGSDGVYAVRWTSHLPLPKVIATKQKAPRGVWASSPNVYWANGGDGTIMAAPIPP